MNLICSDCKQKKLNVIGVKMNIGIGYACIGKCGLCKSDNRHLYSYSEGDLYVFDKGEEK